MIESFESMDLERAYNVSVLKRYEYPFTIRRDFIDEAAYDIMINVLLGVRSNTRHELYLALLV